MMVPNYLAKDPVHLRSTTTYQNLKILHQCRSINSAVDQDDP